MVSKKDRKDFEEGGRDRKKGSVDQFFIDLTRIHPDTDAYHKGRRGDQLDGDKKKGR